MSAAPPLDWIQKIETSLAELDEKPQFGFPKPFDWEKFDAELKAILNASAHLKTTVKGWMAPNQIFAGLGGKLLPLVIEWSPLHPPVFFITDQQNIKELMASVFQSQEAANYFYDADYVQGFYHYFAAEVLQAIEKQNFASPLAPRLGLDPEDFRQTLGEEPCFVMDLALTFDGKNFWGRILVSESFRREWKRYFAHIGAPQLSEEMKEKVLVDIGLEVAHTRLSFKEWKKVKEGDFILLDHCSYDPALHKGGVMLTLKQKPIFRGRFKEGGIKITNYPVYEEVSDTMNNDPFSKDFDADEEDDDDLYSDLEEDEDSEFEDEEEDILAGLEPRKSPPAKEKAKEGDKETLVKAALAPPDEEAAPSSISTEDLPIHVTVEVGKVRMSVGSLLKLTPGNLLELNVSPEQGVDLVVNGKKIGRGELIRIGDILGVRILSL